MSLRSTDSLIRFGLLALPLAGLLALVGLYSTLQLDVCCEVSCPQIVHPSLRSGDSLPTFYFRKPSGHPNWDVEYPHVAW